MSVSFSGYKMPMGYNPNFLAWHEVFYDLTPGDLTLYLVTLHLNFLNYCWFPKQAMLFHKSLPLLTLFRLPKIPFPDKYLLDFQGSEVCCLLEIIFWICVSSSPGRTKHAFLCASAVDCTCICHSIFNTLIYLILCKSIFLC